MGAYLSAAWERLDLVSLILGALIGVIPSTWASFYLKRPKLRLVGSSSGGGPPYSVFMIAVRNVPALIGFKVPATTIFGWRLHSDHQFGVDVDRDPARNCSAHIIDKRTGESIGWLPWQTDKGISHQVNLGPGEQANLMVFARSHSSPRSYFIIEQFDSSSHRPIAPKEERHLEDGRNFIIELHYLDRVQERIQVDVQKMMRGSYLAEAFIGRRRNEASGGF